MRWSMRQLYCSVPSVWGDVETQFETPAEVFGSGTHFCMIVLVIELMRFAGITLPGNGAPVSGSVTTVEPKLPDRCAGVGTVVSWVIPFTMRVPS